MLFAYFSGASGNVNNHSLIKGSAEHMEEVFAEMLSEIYKNGTPDFGA